MLLDVDIRYHSQSQIPALVAHLVASLNANANANGASVFPLHTTNRSTTTTATTPAIQSSDTSIDDVDVVDDDSDGWLAREQEERLQKLTSWRQQIMLSALR